MPQNKLRMPQKYRKENQIETIKFYNNVDNIIQNITKLSHLLNTLNFF